MWVCNFTGRVGGDPVVSTAEAVYTVWPGLRRAHQCKKILGEWLIRFLGDWRAVSADKHTFFCVQARTRTHMLLNFAALDLFKHTPTAPTHPNFEKPQVLDGFIDYSIELWDILIRPCFAVRRHGWFLAAGHLVMIQNWCWKLVMEKWDSASRTHIWLVTASSSQAVENQNSEKL